MQIITHFSLAHVLVNKQFFSHFLFIYYASSFLFYDFFCSIIFLFFIDKSFALQFENK
jgi:hypothetical protein